MNPHTPNMDLTTKREKGKEGKKIPQVVIIDEDRIYYFDCSNFHT